MRNPQDVDVFGVRSGMHGRGDGEKERERDGDFHSSLLILTLGFNSSEVELDSIISVSFFRESKL